MRSVLGARKSWFVCFLVCGYLDGEAPYSSSNLADHFRLRLFWVGISVWGWGRNRGTLSCLLLIMFGRKEVGYRGRGVRGINKDGRALLVFADERYIWGKVGEMEGDCGVSKMISDLRPIASVQGVVEGCGLSFRLVEGGISFFLREGGRGGRICGRK